MEWNTLALASLGGILPALVWLLFWLIEDRKNPEPGIRISTTFLLGMLAVVLVLPFQKAVQTFFGDLIVTSVILWAILEEVFKLVAGYWGGLRSEDDNEPLDPLVYMITAALGFVALENTLFILGPFLEHRWLDGLITGNLRFIGASLLHVVTSGIVGVAISFSFYQNTLRKRYITSIGVITAILFHAIFNILIIKFGTEGTGIAFVSVWSGVIFLLWAFERIKSIARID